jgi:uncharacterized protein
MPAGITRERALALLHAHVAGPNMIKHSLAAEAVLTALADRLGADRGAWAIAGLLHDVDFEVTNGDPAVHGRESVRILQANGVDAEVVTAIQRHNAQSTDESRTTALDHALAAGETMTGLIVAVALILPDRRLASVKVKSITKRVKERDFAPGVDRDTIMECETLGLDLSEFAQLALTAMQGVSEALGL